MHQTLLSQNIRIPDRWINNKIKQPSCYRSTFCRETLDPGVNVDPSWNKPSAHTLGNKARTSLHQHPRDIGPPQKRHDKQLEVSTWPQDIPHPNVSESHAPYDPWRAVNLRAFTLSTLFLMALWIKDHSHECQDPSFSAPWSGSPTLSAMHFYVVAHWFNQCSG